VVEVVCVYIFLVPSVAVNVFPYAVKVVELYAVLNVNVKDIIQNSNILIYHFELYTLKYLYYTTT
jgi:hypothetical protein